MADGIHITIELKQQRKLLSLRDVRTLHQNSVRVQGLLEDLGTEPFGNQSDFQVTAVTVVGDGTEIHDTVCVEGRTVALGIQADAHRTGDRLGKIGEKIGKNVNNKVGGVAGFVGGTVGGTLVSSATRAAGNLLHEDDVLIAARLINAAITNLCLDYMFSEKEVQMLIGTLDSKENLKSLKKLQQNVIMSKTQYKDIVDVLTPIFDEIVKTRPVINKEMEQEMMDSMSEDICDKVEDAVGEDGSEEENDE